VSTGLVRAWLTSFPLGSEARRADARQASSHRVLGDGDVEADVTTAEEVLAALEAETDDEDDDDELRE
jgi:hypothetical protein